MKRWLWRAKIILPAAATVLMLGLAWAYLPRSYEATVADFRPSDVYLYDRHGDVIHVLRTNHSKRQFAWLDLNDVSPRFLQSLIAAEDKRFYSHFGVDPIAMLRAAKLWVKSGKVTGASTISMQLAKQLYRKAAGRSIVAKFHQILAAMFIELRWSKAEILSAYVNSVSFRGEVQGINAASQMFFAKQATGLDQDESALLVAMLRAPNASQAEVVRRACVILERPGCAFVGLDLNRPSHAHFAKLLPKHAPHAARQIIKTNKAKRIETSLDRRIQLELTQILRDHMSNIYRENALDAAAIVVENSTGQILAYVGSSDVHSRAAFVDSGIAMRQAGSTLKPFIYGLAFEKKYLTPATIIDDKPIEIPISAGGVYRPSNHDRSFRGAVSVRDALAGSLNIPAVRALQMVGVDAALDFMSHIGFKNLREAEYYGPSLALGSVEVSLMELAEAYVMLANLGEHRALSWQRAETATSERVLSEDAAFLVRSILSDNIARAPSFGMQNHLLTSIPTAVKTGTSKDMRDNWCVGFSPTYTVAVWVGNADGSPMWNLTGISGAGPVWASIIHRLHARTAPVAFSSAPRGVISKTVKFSFKDLSQDEWFIEGTEPATSEIEEIEALPKHMIAYPTDQAVLAYDPGIPAANQKVVFRAARWADNYYWKLNDKTFSNSSRTIEWQVVRGSYKLALHDQNHKQLDLVDFIVK